MAIFDSLSIVLGEHPNLVPHGYEITSPETIAYNCIAWASGNDTKFWWPDPLNQAFWPDDVPREETIEAFIEMFSKLGYVLTENRAFEDGFEKVAIYADANSVPTHAAKQLNDGSWSSKLGCFHDIVHTLEGLEDDVYGSPVIFMKRQANST